MCVCVCIYIPNLICLMYLWHRSPLFSKNYLKCSCLQESQGELSCPPKEIKKKNAQFKQFYHGEQGAALLQWYKKTITNQFLWNFCCCFDYMSHCLSAFPHPYQRLWVKPTCLHADLLETFKWQCELGLIHRGQSPECLLSTPLLPPSHSKPDYNIFEWLSTCPCTSPWHSEWTAFHHKSCNRTHDYPMRISLSRTNRGSIINNTHIDNVKLWTHTAWPFRVLMFQEHLRTGRMCLMRARESKVWSVVINLKRRWCKTTLNQKCQNYSV